MLIEDYHRIKKRIQQCTLCRLSETRKNVVPGTGCLNPEIMIVGQAPGREENRAGEMFIGPSGKVLDKLFDELGLKKENFYMTNMLKCFLPNSRKPRNDEIEACSIYLMEEFELADPDIIIPLGYHVTKFILKKYKFEIPCSDNFPKLFGSLLVANNRKILPLRHPATVVHESARYETLLLNYRKINIVTKTCKWFNSCPVKTFYEQGKLTKYWIDRYCKGDWETCKRFQMEEKKQYHPDNMLPDGSFDYNL
ncbi:MAG: uracil-DNA glycosylase [Bacteroidales bacterium]